MGEWADSSRDLRRSKNSPGFPGSAPMADREPVPVRIRSGEASAMDRFAVYPEEHSAIRCSGEYPEAAFAIRCFEEHPGERSAIRCFEEHPEGHSAIRCFEEHPEGHSAIRRSGKDPEEPLAVMLLLQPWEPGMMRCRSPGKRRQNRKRVRLYSLDRESSCFHSYAIPPLYPVIAVYSGAPAGGCIGPP